jgi:hypothetical protein
MQLCKYDLIRELGELGASKIHVEDQERERVTGKRSIGPSLVGRGDDAEAADWRRRWRQPRETGKE